MTPKVDEDHYGMGVLLSGGYMLLRCRKCSALVDAFFQQEHAIWHEKLRRAVDEGQPLA